MTYSLTVLVEALVEHKYETQQSDWPQTNQGLRRGQQGSVGSTNAASPPEELIGIVGVLPNNSAWLLPAEPAVSSSGRDRRGSRLFN